MVDDHTRLNIHVCRLTHKITRTHVRRSTFELWFGGSLAAARLCSAQLRSAVVLGGACSCHGQLITIHRTETAATAATAATQRRRAMTAISEKMRPNAPRSTCLPGTPRQKVESIVAASREEASGTMQRQLRRPPFSNIETQHSALRTPQPGKS